MKPPALLAVLLVAGACSSTPSAAVSTPPTPSPSPAASASATPAVPGDLPVTTVDFSCRLPVTMQTASPSGWTGGFIDFPFGSYEADPGSVIHMATDGSLATQNPPGLKGYTTGAPFYDLASKRWLPVARNHSSPNGATYAYVSPWTGPQSVISIVTVGTGSVKHISILGNNWIVGDFDGRYVYLLEDLQTAHPLGVWRLDTATGSLILPTLVRNVVAVADGAVWAVGRDGTPDWSSPYDVYDTLLKFNALSGRWVSWSAGNLVTFLTVDSKGRPVVRLESELRRIDRPGSDGELIYKGNLQFSSAEADGDRLWLGGKAGIYVYTSAHGLQKVFAYTGASPAIQPAGFCR